MDTHGRRTALRLLAPIAIAVFAIALVVVLSGRNGGGGGNAATKAAGARDLGTTTVAHTTHRRRSGGSSGSGSGSGQLPQTVYVVKSGDTLGGIAQKTGVPINQLQNLNPGLDQFSLVAGQRIKLR